MDFVSKVMPLVFNMLPRLVIAFLPRSKCLLFMAAVTICSDFEAQKNKVYSGLYLYLLSLKHRTMLFLFLVPGCCSNIGEDKNK